jgi:hypothetical protein
MMQCRNQRVRKLRWWHENKSVSPAPHTPSLVFLSHLASLSQRRSISSALFCSQIRHAQWACDHACLVKRVCLAGNTSSSFQMVAVRRHCTAVLILSAAPSKVTLLTQNNGTSSWRERTRKHGSPGAHASFTLALHHARWAGVVADRVLDHTREGYLALLQIYDKGVNAQYIP